MKKKTILGLIITQAVVDPKDYGNGPIPLSKSRIHFFGLDPGDEPLFLQTFIPGEMYEGDEILKVEIKYE